MEPARPGETGGPRQASWAPRTFRRRCCIRSSARRARVSERKLASSQRWTSCSRVFWYQASVSFDHWARVADELFVFVGYGRPEPFEVDVGQGRALVLQARFDAAELHGEACALDRDRGRAAKLLRDADPGQRADDPLARVPLPPANPVPVVMGELVMEVVVALAVGQDGEPAVVAGAVLVAVGLATEGMRGRIDQEGQVMADDQAQHAGEQEHAPEVAVQPAERERHEHVEPDGEHVVVLVLERDDRVALQVPDIAEIRVGCSGSGAASSRCARTRGRGLPNRDRDRCRRRTGDGCGGPRTRPGCCSAAPSRRGSCKRAAATSARRRSGATTGGDSPS